MFRATMGPSSGETSVYVRQFALVILCGWLSGMHTEKNLCTKLVLFTRFRSITFFLFGHARLVCVVTITILWNFFYAVVLIFVETHFFIL